MPEQEELWRGSGTVCFSESTTGSEPSASLWKHAWWRLRRNKLAVAGGSAIMLMAY